MLPRTPIDATNAALRQRVRKKSAERTRPSIGRDHLAIRRARTALGGNSPHDGSGPSSSSLNSPWGHAFLVTERFPLGPLVATTQEFISTTMVTEASASVRSTSTSTRKLCTS